MVAAHMRVPTAYRYGVIRISSVCASVCGASSTDSGFTPAAAGVVLVFSTFKFKAKVRT